MGFLNSTIYTIGKMNKTYPLSFHDITQGTNSSFQYDANGNPIAIMGYDAGDGWDATTGTGSPIGVTLVDALIRNLQQGDQESAINTTKHGQDNGQKHDNKKDPH
jgi:hypothetical protein